MCRADNGSGSTSGDPGGRFTSALEHGLGLGTLAALHGELVQQLNTFELSPEHVLLRSLPDSVARLGGLLDLIRYRKFGQGNKWRVLFIGSLRWL